jgi:hypothetical protein
MEGSTLLIWILIGFVGLFIVYLIVAHYYGIKGPQDICPTEVSLNTKHNLMASDQAAAFLSGAGGTLSGLLSVDMGDRTANMNASSFSMLFGIKDGVEFQLAPASAERKGTARLVIATGKGPEIVDLPAYPLQKCTFLTILRDGRRFDVLYDNQIVASHRLEQYPSSVTSPISVGGPAFIGKAVHVLLATRRLTPQEVAVERARYTDTTGCSPPPIPFPYTFSLPNLLTFCIPGFPCDPVTTPPPNTMKTWSSMYN